MDHNQFTLRGLIFVGIIFREVREFFRKFAKNNPRENFKNLLIREILDFLPKSPRKMKEIL